MSDGGNGAQSGAAELDRRLALLQGTAILFSVPVPSLRRLARQLEPVVQSANTEVVHQGVPADHLYLIESGRCEMRVEGEKGHVVTIAVLTTGDFFGSEAAEPDSPYMASLIATERARLFTLSRGELLKTLALNPTAQAEIDRVIVQRRAKIEQLQQRARKVMHERAATVMAVYSTKGGAGKTTTAVNVAAALAREQPGECLLLDLAFPYNHAALAANLVPSSCLALSERAGMENFEETLLSAILHHPGGMMLLPGTLKVEHSELISPALVDRALEVLSRNFTYVVIDLGITLSETTLRVLEQADRIVLLVSPEVSSLKDTAELLGILRNVLGVPDGVISLALNRSRPSARIGRLDAERALGRPLNWDLPFDATRADWAGVSGEILVLSHPSSTIARGFSAIAADMKATRPAVRRAAH